MWYSIIQLLQMPVNFFIFRFAGTLDNSRCVISLQGEKKFQVCCLRQLGLICVYLSYRDFCSGSEKGCFPSNCHKPGDLRQDLCEKSPPWSCWEMSKAMQSVGPSVRLINPESIAITLGSQPKANMVLCPFHSL